MQKSNSKIVHFYNSTASNSVRSTDLATANLFDFKIHVISGELAR